MIPLNVFLLRNPDYHSVICSLLLAAGVCYGMGQYKYTVDISKPRGLRLVKVIAVTQFGVIVVTRVFVFIMCGARLLAAV